MPGQVAVARVNQQLLPNPGSADDRGQRKGKGLQPDRYHQPGWGAAGEGPRSPATPGGLRGRGSALGGLAS